MNPFRTLRDLSRSVEHLDNTAAETADDVTLTSSAIRSAAYSVDAAGAAVQTFAQLATGLLVAITLGWSVGTVIRVILDRFPD